MTLSKQDILSTLSRASHSPVRVIQKVPIEHLERELLDENGELRFLPAKVYQRIPRQELLYFAAVHALYTFPTFELVDWILQEIGDRSALEICAGRSNLGRFLFIPRTDSFVCTEDREVQLRNAMAGQQVVAPCWDVERLEAFSAVAHYRPHVVVGAFVSHKFNPERAELGGYHAGVDEERLLTMVEAYILVGNEEIHGPHMKSIHRYPHRTFKAPWIVTRARRTDLNRIYIWPGRR